MSKKTNRSQREKAPLKTGPQVRLINDLPNNDASIITARTIRKRIRTISCLVGVAISTACIVFFSSKVSAQDVIYEHDGGKKNFINSERKKRRGLFGAWNRDEEDLPLNAVKSKAFKEPSNLKSSTLRIKGKSVKNDFHESSSSGWSSLQKPTSGQPTPWVAVGYLPTTSSKPTKPPTAPNTTRPQAPTYTPTAGEPTYSPTRTSSLTQPPSSTPSLKPTSFPSSLPSYSPSSGPSPMRSSAPKMSSKPTPVYIPSAHPTVSSHPTTPPASAYPTSSSSLPLRDTAAPTISPKPTTTQRTARPTWAPTISHEPSWAERTGRPTWTPTVSQEPTSAGRTLQPTLSPTATAFPTAIASQLLPSASFTPTVSSEPTSLLVTDPRSGLTMELFGVEFMDDSQIVLFQDRTALYMDEFYNGADSKGLLDLIKSQVTDMTVVINVVQQTPPGDLLGGVRDRTLQASGMKKRELQLSVSDPCLGDPLTVTFDMVLQYRTADPMLARSDEVISFPFRTKSFRKDYIKSYLKADDGGAFDDLYCTSPIIFPGDSKLGVPTLAPTVTGTNNNGTLAPTVPGTNNGTLAPTVAGTNNGTLAPTVAGTNNGTLAPTVAGTNNETLAPTVAGTNNGTLAPTQSIKPTTMGSSSNSTSPSPTSSKSLIPTTSMPPSTGYSPLPSTNTQEPLQTANLRMGMYGLIQQLEFLGVQLYNKRTARYIESFYNDYDSTEGFRGQVLDVTATVEVTDQIVVPGEPPIEDELPTIRRPRNNGYDENFMMNESNEDESYLPKYATVDNYNFVNTRYRFDGNNMGGKTQQQGTRTLQIESCTGNRVDLVFTASLTYRLTDGSLTEAEIINEPFRTFLSRRIYMEDFLKGPDAGPFVDLTCTGEVIFPSDGSPTVSPLISLAPTDENPSPRPSVPGTGGVSMVPTLDIEMPSQQPSSQALSRDPISSLSSPPFTLGGVPTSSPMRDDDLLNDLGLVRSGTLSEKTCHDEVDPRLRASSEEIQISFLYGAQSKTADHFFLDELEGLILDFLRESVLMCLEGGKQTASQLWKIDDQQETAGVIRVRYPEIGATTISKCDPTLVDAKGCIVLDTKLLVTSVGVPVSKVHSDVLMLLNDAFKEGLFVDIIPDLILTNYLGPDPEEFRLQLEAMTLSSNTQQGIKSSQAIAFSFCVTVIVLAGLAAWFAFPLVRQELFKSAHACFTRLRQPLGVEENSLIVRGPQLGQ